MSLTEASYKLASSLPSTERYELSSQIRRASSSVPMNIAEGYGSGQRGQFLYHLRKARGSLAELSTAFELTVRLGMVPNTSGVDAIQAETDRVLQGLIRSLEGKED